jgi:hypothetical protein
MSVSSFILQIRARAQDPDGFFSLRDPWKNVFRSNGFSHNALSAIADWEAHGSPDVVDLYFETHRRDFHHEAGLMEVKNASPPSRKWDLINGKPDRRGGRGFITATRFAQGPARRDQPPR